MNYFTADTHFFHKQLLGNNDFAPRPFANVNIMNQTIIDNWNKRVSNTDTVYHLGDIAMCPGDYPSPQEVLEILNQLNGQLELIKGNHDHHDLFKYLDKHNYEVESGKPKFIFHDVGAIIKFDHHQFIMTHYPLMMGIVKNQINLHGHIHNNSVPIAEDINVGVDAPELRYLDCKLPFGTPLRSEEIIEIYNRKKSLLAKMQNNKG